LHLDNDVDTIAAVVYKSDLDGNGKIDLEEIESVIFQLWLAHQLTRLTKKS
jgi:hypothetical protein